MFRLLLCIGFYLFVYKQKGLQTRRLYGLKYIDHNMENKTIFDKFEYYSIIGNREKQLECFREIHEHINNRTK